MGIKIWRAEDVLQTREESSGYQNLGQGRLNASALPYRAA